MDLTSESRHPAWQGALTAGVWGKWFGILYFSNFLAPNYNLYGFQPHLAQFFCLNVVYVLQNPLDHAKKWNSIEKNHH